MNPNTHSTSPGPSTGEPSRRPDGLAALKAVVNQLAAQSPGRPARPGPGHPGPTAPPTPGPPARPLAERARHHRRPRGRRHRPGPPSPAPSTAGWRRTRLHLGTRAATRAVRTARALIPRPLPQPAQALTDGQLSPAHAAVLTAGTQHLPTPTTVKAEPGLLEAAGRLDPPRLRRVVGHLRLVADPDPAQADRQQRGRTPTSK
jgi:hypothetical protein